MATKIDLVDLYAFHDAFDGNILESLMFDSHISCKIKARFAQRFGSDDFFEKSIAVEDGMVESARALISNAIRCGILSAEGRFKT